MQSPRPTVLERAFELARSGKHPLVEGIRKQLRAEGYSIEQLSGPSLLRQLRDVSACARARSAKDADQEPVSGT